MSINQLSSELPESQWWSSSQHSLWFHPMKGFDLNNQDDEELSEQDRLFEKPLTPSDVGKLNRLVIPKQHAEKHFPLNGGGDNGLLLGFEDELGKPWRFRYSYWNSSQSYVLTKGWSRFVKEKRLDAGDIVIFGRHRVDSGRLFIGWRRRNSGSQQPPWGRALYSSDHQQTSINSSHDDDGGGGGVQRQKQKQTSSSSGSGQSKMVRLFGVNLECREDSTAVPMSTQYPYYYSSNLHHHMDISFSGADVYRQG